MACGTEIVPGYKEFNKKANEVAKDPALDMKMNQLLSKEMKFREGQFNAGVITAKERDAAINKERNRLALKKRTFQAQGNPNTGEIEYRESNTASVLNELSKRPGELGQMSRYLKDSGIEHSLRLKKAKRNQDGISLGGSTKWTPVGIIVDPREVGSNNKFDNLYDLLVAMGEDPKGPAAQYNNKLSNEESIRMERAWIRKTGENWQGQEMSVQEFNSYI